MFFYANQRTLWERERNICFGIALPIQICTNNIWGKGTATDGQQQLRKHKYFPLSLQLVLREIQEKINKYPCFSQQLGQFLTALSLSLSANQLEKKLHFPLTFTSTHILCVRVNGSGLTQPSVGHREREAERDNGV